MRLLLALALVGAVSCKAADPAKPTKPKAPPVTDITAEDYAMPALPKARVVLTDAFGGAHQVVVEIAATKDARTRGLMWRSSLPEGVGMLFIFPLEEDLSFWMKNTLIPLDMIFIGKDRKIVGIQERAEPRTLSARPSGAPAQFVLEVPGGWSEKIGLKPGLAVKLEGLAGVNVTEWFTSVRAGTPTALPETRGNSIWLGAS